MIAEIKRGVFIPVISEVVKSEIETAPPAVRAKYEEIITAQPLWLITNDEALELARAYQKHRILTNKFFTDGLHIALATVNKIDLVVSWNFKHIVHFDKIRLFNAVNLQLGYQPIEIYSPMEVTQK